MTNIANRTTDPTYCEQCAQNGKTCCSLDSLELADLCFPLSEREQQKLTTFLDKKQGIAECPNSKEFITAMCQLFPAEKEQVKKLFPHNGTHKRLELHPNGDCVFLAKTGCNLPREVRPLYCTLFPFWFIGTQSVFLQAEQCVVLNKTKGKLPAVLAALSTTEPHIVQIFLALKNAWGFTIHNK